MKARLAISLLLLLSSACTKQPQTPQASQATEQSDPQDKLVNDYLSAVKKGETGQEFWCKDEDPETLFSVSQTEILNVKDESAMLKNGRWYVTRISSSTQSGQPIVKTWNIGVRGDGGPCISDLVDRDKYGG